jgi:hypothetical protein
LSLVSILFRADLMVTQESDAGSKNAALHRSGSLGRWPLIATLFYLAVVLICAVVLSEDYWILGVIFSLALGLVAGVVFHEFGHMACAALLSFPIRLVSIGRGPLLWCCRIGETQFELHAVPLSGCVLLYPQLVIRKFSSLLFLFGGVLGNAAVIALVAVVDEARLVLAWRDYLGPIVLVQCYMIIANLVPFWTNVRGVRIGSDGLQLLLTALGPWRGPTQAGLIYAARLDGYGGAKRTPPRATARLIYQLIRSDHWTDAEARRDYEDALQRELGRRTLSREETMLVLDGLLTSALMHRSPQLRAHLDAWSEQALQLGPDIATLRGTRGAVLVELGRYEEGKALLAPLASSQPGSAFDAFMISVSLARAEHGIGNVAAARAFAAAARENVSAVPGAAFMLSRLDAELAASSEQPDCTPQSETASSASQP